MTQQEKAMSDVKRKIDNAIKLVSDLCKPRGSAGAREWIMSIPARPDYDPDIVISDALYSASTEITRLTKQLAESQRQNAELQEAIAAQILTNPKEKIEIKFSDEAQAKEMIKIVKENAELRGLLGECEHRLMMGRPIAEIVHLISKALAGKE